MKNCLQCNKEFQKDPRSVFCSRECAYISPIRKEKIKLKIVQFYENGGTVPSYWLGKKQPKEAVEKMRRSLIGLRSGSKNPMWRGGITDPRKQIMKTLKYKNWRMEVFKRDNFACTECGITGVFLNADHIKSFSKFPSLRFDINNGRTLCVPCHQKTPNYGYKALIINV